MNQKQVLLNCITLLYREHQRNNNNDHSTDLINEVVDTIKLPAVVIDNDRGFHTMSELKLLVFDLINTPPQQMIEKTDLLQRFRIVCENDDNLYFAFETGINQDLDETTLNKVCVNFRHKLRNYLTSHTIRNVLVDKSRVAFSNDPRTNWRDVALQAISELEPHTVTHGEGTDPGVVAETNLEDIQVLEDYFKDAITEESTEGVLTTGLTGINLMLNPERKGLRRGEFVVTSAMQYGFKSGFSLLCFVTIALFNKPFLYDKNKKPMLMYVSAENEMNRNLMWMYVYLKENMEGVKVTESEIDAKEAAEYLATVLKKNGWAFDIVRIDPTDYSYQDFFNRVLKNEAKGYEVVFCLFDYLNMISKKGCTLTSGTGSDIRDLFRRVRNFTSKKKITFMTPHQISTDANQYIRDEVDDVVKKFANRNFYDGCRTLAQEPDLEIVLHKVIKNGKAYITIARGKHRYTNTDEKYLYVVYAFEDIGTIPWDVDKEPKYMRKIPGRSGSAAEDIDFF